MIKAQNLAQEQRIAMGAGWIIENLDLSFKCGIVHFPSSTRPELIAILTALLAISLNMFVTIYTDSQAVINGINGIMSMKSTRQILKMMNHSILSVIKQLILTKDVEFKMVKVKGHSGVLYNEKADIIAKEVAAQVMDGTLGVIDLVDSKVGHRINFYLT